MRLIFKLNYILIPVTALLLIFNNAIANDKDITKLITKEELKCVKESYSFLKKKEIDTALLLSLICDSDAANKMINWQIIYDNQISTDDLSLDFYLKLNNFPKREVLFNNLSKNISLTQDYDNILLFFTDKYPNYKNAYYAFVNALNTTEVKNYNNQEIANATRHYFLSNNFDIGYFKDFVTDNSDIIGQELLYKKISKLILDKEYDKANKLIPYSIKEKQQLFKTRISFALNKKYAPRDLKKLPEKLRQDEGLYYDIVKWLERKDDDTKITPYLNALVNPEYNDKWFKSRLRHARHLLNENQANIAYEILVNHNMTAGTAAYAEAEWLLGWIALRFTNKPKLAITHFKQLYNNVGYALSVSRAAYWLARAYEANKQPQDAKEYYKIASNYSSTYYGQMAILKLNHEVIIDLPKFNHISETELKEFVNNNDLIKIGLYYSYLGNNKNALIFFKKYIKDNHKNTSLEKIISLSLYSNNYEIINKIARYATRFNFISAENYPIIKSLSGNLKENALTMSIVKQESGFNTKAVSKAGALGFMQLMPKTAKEMARRMKIPFSKRKLRSNPDYNIRIGTYYIKHLLNRYDNSNILAIAAYNAGPSNVNRWLKQNGDIREFSDMYDIIDWVEKITFPETRNYVQRILETSIIYSNIL